MRTLDTLPGLSLLLASLVAPALHAQPFPSKPMRILVGFPAGGPADFFSRTLGQKVTELTGQPVVIDNRVGVGGMVAAENLVRSPADGHTVLLSSSGLLAFHQHLYSKMALDPFKDLAPVSLAVGVPEILVVHPSLPVRSVKEFVALTKARPSQINYASAGAGGMPHLAAEALNISAQMKMNHVPYKGAAPAVTELLGGQVHATVLDVPVLLPHIRSGRMRALAILTDKRSPVLPELATIVEAGYPDVRADNWYGLVAHGGTPKELLGRVSALMAKALNSPDVKEKLLVQGANAIGSTPEEFAAFWRVEHDRWGKIIRTVGIKLD